MGEMIRYLEQWEKGRTIPLWREAFPEDTKEFVEYYYEEKARDNRILVLEEMPEDGRTSRKTADESEGSWIPEGWRQTREDQSHEQPESRKQLPKDQSDEQPESRKQLSESLDRAQSGDGGWAGQSRIVSMVHRNPYRLRLGGCQAEIDYVVAVATAEDRRHRGYMRRLLLKMLEDMHREGRAFCFLMPADRRIYEPFGFRFIYDQAHWKLTGEAEERLEKQIAAPEAAGLAAQWMEQWLRERYQVYAVRDHAYVERLLTELASEEGWLEFLRDGREDDGRLAGVRAWWGREQTEQRLLLCGEKYREEEKPPAPAIMARITDVKRCLEMIRLKRESRMGEMEVALHVEDSLCPWNQGTFLWKLDSQGSRVTEIEGEDSPGLHGGRETVPAWDFPAAAVRGERPENSGEWTITIEDLTQWVFGYEDAQSPREADSRDSWRQEIGVWRNVFLDEIV